jgi:hypothetical protein
MELACSSENGVWSKIDNNDEIVDSLNSYYQLFALGLGKENVKAWVEPYIYLTGGVLGTTVSRPVYDNSRDPAILIGVIGIDLPLGAIGKASDNKTSSEILADAVGAGTCPEVNLTVCLLESYRRLNGGATCNASCSENDLVDVKAANCSFLEKFPTNLWSNINSSGKLYVVSAGCKVVKYCFGVACCMSGPTLSSYSSCPAVLVPSGVPPSSLAPNAPIVVTSVPTGKRPKINIGAIAGIVVGAVVLIVVLFACWIWKSDKQNGQGPVVGPNTPLSNNSVASSNTSKQPTGNDILPDKTPHTLASSTHK